MKGQDIGTIIRSGKAPRISYYAYEESSSQIIGNVVIEDNVFIGPGAIIRADEPGSSIHILKNSNVQDRAVLHAGKDDSIVIGPNTSLAHGSIVIGSVCIGTKCFIGFGSIVDNAEIQDEVFIKHLACIENVTIRKECFVESGKTVSTSSAAGTLPTVSEEQKAFAARVARENVRLADGYNR